LIDGRVRRLVRRICAAFLFIWVWPAEVWAEPVDLELVLALDTSLSVSSEEFALQVEGLARAFRDPRVIAAIRSGGDRGVAVTVIQWASSGDQAQIIGWTKLQSRESALAFSRQIGGMPRRFVGYGTSIYSALRFSAGLFFANGFEGLRRVIDISGDGSDNRGPMPDIMRDRASYSGITINGLAIRNEEPNLDFYYQQHVIGGFGAFVAVAENYRDFANAIIAKLIREIAATPMTRLPNGPAPRALNASVTPQRLLNPGSSSGIM